MAKIKRGRRIYAGNATTANQKPWTNQITVAFTGAAAAGAITVTSNPALRVGDIVQGCVNAVAGTEDSANFEYTITVAGQIQQSSASNLSANKYIALILRK